MSITSKEVGERVQENNLTVSSPFLEGIGSYTCMAENVVDAANSTAEVVIFCESLLDSYSTENGCIPSTVSYPAPHLLTYWHI